MRERAADRAIESDSAARDHNASEGVGFVGSLPLLLAGIAVLYVSFGIILGLAQGSLPPLLRARGVDLAAIGWSYALLLPFGLTFLWAPLVDAVTPMPSAPRVGWILVAQAVVVAILLGVAQGESFPPVVLVLLGLVLAFAAATMDVALDALATAAVPPRARPIAAGLKVAALSLGSMIGGGVLLGTSQRLGWHGTFELVALATALATLPILLARGWDARVRDARARRPSLATLAGQPVTRRRLALLSSATIVIFALFSLNRLMLVDAGVSIARIGWIVGIGAPLCGLVASLLAIPILRRLGWRGAFVVFTAICVAASLAIVVGIATTRPGVAIAGAIAMTAGTSGLYVIFCAFVLGWARGGQPATDYAALYGVSRLLATLVVIGLTQLVPRIGWPAFYVTAALVLLLVVFAFFRLEPR